jgi:tetratricopeptide (TPR) repeat protein
MTGATGHFSRAAAIRPDKAVLWVALGKALAVDGQWEKAENAFSRAAQLEPEHPAVWFYRGCVRAGRGETREALAFLVECLEKERQRDPRIDSVYLKVMDFYENGLYYEGQGQLPVAGRHYTEALALIHMDVSQRQLTRLIISGYDQWLKEITAFERGAD